MSVNENNASKQSLNESKIYDKSTAKKATSSKLGDLHSISRRCSFMANALRAPFVLSKIELNALFSIVNHTKDSEQTIQDINECLDHELDNNSEPAMETVVEIPDHPTCDWISSITECKHCQNCDMCGIIKTPIAFGFNPWNTTKRTMMLVGDLDDEIMVSEAVLQEHPDIYFQGERLVRVVSNKLKAVSGSAHIPQEIQSLSAPNLQEILSHEFVFLKVEPKRIRAVYPPPALVKGLLQRAKYPSLKHLRAITDVPVLRLDGTVLQTPGYDSETELLFQPSQAFPGVPDFPTEPEIQAALDQLLDVVCDFPFANDLGRAVYLSTVLTVVGRFAFHGCVPMVLIDANTPGVGKTKLADAIGLITTGNPLPRSTQAAYALEERRQITSILLKGERLLLIDNIGSRFGSPVLDALLTSETWQDRILGRSTEATMPNLLQVIATGNNLQLKADTVRRCIRMQLACSDEHPEARSEFRHPDLEAWVTSLQPQLLTAALTLLRGYIAAGKPEQELVTMGSFAGWSSLIQSTVKWAYGVDPGEARIVADDEMDLDKEILERLMRGWNGLVPDGASISCRKLIDRTLQDEGNAGCDILEALEMGNGCGKKTAVALGHLLTRFRKRVHQSRHFDHASQVHTAEGRLWKLFTLR